jgi:hypothetical protein
VHHYRHFSLSWVCETPNKIQWLYVYGYACTAHLARAQQESHCSQHSDTCAALLCVISPHLARLHGAAHVIKPFARHPVDSQAAEGDHRLGIRDRRYGSMLSWYYFLWGRYVYILCFLVIDYFRF